jgi:hypothetical protein
MDQLHAVEVVETGVLFKNPSKKTLDAVISKIKEESFKGLVCAFDMTGRILYRNDRLRLFLKEGTFFDVISAKERVRIVEELRRLHGQGEAVENARFSAPLIVGRHLIEREKIQGELVTFSEGLVLKIPEEVLEKIIETELERLKLLLLKHPSAGLFVVDEHDVVVDVLKGSCTTNLGWLEEDLLGKDIHTIIAKPHQGGEEVYVIDRIRKDGAHVRTKVVEGRVTLSNKKNYKVYLDTYLR